MTRKSGAIVFLPEVIPRAGNGRLVLKDANCTVMDGNCTIPSTRVGMALRYRVREQPSSSPTAESLLVEVKADTLHEPDSTPVYPKISEEARALQLADQRRARREVKLELAGHDRRGKDEYRRRQQSEVFQGTSPNTSWGASSCGTDATEAIARPRTQQMKRQMKARYQQRRLRNVRGHLYLRTTKDTEEEKELVQESEEPEEGVLSSKSRRRRDRRKRQKERKVSMIVWCGLFRICKDQGPA